MTSVSCSEVRIRELLISSPCSEEAADNKKLKKQNRPERSKMRTLNKPSAVRPSSLLAGWTAHQHSF